MAEPTIRVFAVFAASKKQLFAFLAAIKRKVTKKVAFFAANQKETFAFLAAIKKSFCLKLTNKVAFLLLIKKKLLPFWLPSKEKTLQYRSRTVRTVAET